MGLFDWLGEQASRAVTAAGNTANWIGDGITHPIDAIGSAAQQVINAPAYYDALNHGFTNVADYQNYLATHDPSINNTYLPGQQAVNGVINAIPGAGAILQNGASVGTTFGAGSNGVPNSIGTPAVNTGMTYTPPPSAPTPTFDNAVTNALAANPVPTGVNFQTNQTPGSVDATVGLVHPTTNLGYTPIDPATINLSGGAQKTINGGVAYWNGTGWQDHPLTSVGTTPVNSSTVNQPSSYYGPAPTPPSTSTVGSSPTLNTMPAGDLTTNLSDPTAGMTQAQEYDYYQHHLDYTQAQHQSFLAKLAAPPSAPTTTPVDDTAAKAAAAAAAAAAAKGTGTPPATTTTPPTTTTTTPPTTGGMPDWSSMAGPAAILAGGLVNAMTTKAAADAQAKAAQDAAAAQAKAAQDAIALQREQYQQQQKNSQPWIDAGTGALHSLSDITAANHQFGMTDFQQDPGYAFRLSEGQKALENSASARGGVLSGSALKGISDYGQNAASQEYQNAFNRYQTQRGSQLNTLQSMAGIGQTATQQVNGAAQNYAGNVGQGMMSAGNATAGGITGAANATASGYVGMGNALNQAISGGLAYQQGNNMMNALVANRGY